MNNVIKEISHRSARLTAAKVLASQVAADFISGPLRVPCNADGLKEIKEEIFSELWSAGYKDLDIGVTFGFQPNSVHVDVNDKHLEALEKMALIKALELSGESDMEIDQIIRETPDSCVGILLRRVTE